MKDYQLNLSVLSKDLDKNKYLDALAAPYNLNVSKFNGCHTQPLNLAILMILI